MTRPFILIADPNRVRRKMLLEACAEAGIDRVDEASSLSETYQLAEMHRPMRVGVAVEFSRTDEFQALKDMLHYISAELVLFGPDGGSVHRVDVPGAARRFAQVLSAGITPVSSAPSRKPAPDSGPRVMAMPSPVSRLVLIGASTGGIPALETILKEFTADCPPTLVVQHMRPGFGEGLIRRLDDLIRPSVKPAGDKVMLQPGTIHIAAGNNRHLAVLQRSGLMIRLLDDAPVSGHCPSVDVLFEHGAALTDKLYISAALLTGMGADGAAGLARLRAAGAYTIAQDHDSSVVWGMPRVAIEMGAAMDVLPLNSIGRALLRENARRE